MTRDNDRRAIAYVLLLILALAAMNGGDARTIALTVAPIAALMARVVAFYFPRAAAKKQKRRS